MSLFSLLFSLSLISISFVSSQSCVANLSRCDQNALFFLSSTTVANIKLRTVVPSVSDSALLLTPESCLGYLGPIGPLGPLGMLGPLGDNTWNPSYWITGSGMEWEDWTKYVGHDGPLSAKGPLGELGPLSQHAYYEVAPCINPFVHHLLNGGVFSILGPLGPLGALGPLGPLGPVGAHGLTTNDQGDFIDGNSGAVKRNAVVPYNSTFTRQFDLYELYLDSDYVKAKNDNDVSFMVQSAITSLNDTYRFTAKEGQYVSILLVPLKELDIFSLEVRTSISKQRIALHNDLGYINWAVVKVTPGTQFIVTVKLVETGQFLAHDYHLFVTGSSTYFQFTDINGDHKKSL